MSLETRFERLQLPLERAFTIARGTSTEAELVVVEIEDENGTVGVGGAGPSTHYGETADTVTAVLPHLLEVVEEAGDPHLLETMEDQMAGVVARNPAARGAVSIALHDLVAKQLDVPLYRYWGLDPSEAVETSFTIGIGETERMVEQAAEAVAAGHDILKIKLGTDRDDEIIAAIRGAVPEVRIRVDANEAWTPREALQTIDALAEQDVEFVEQPVPAGNPEGLKLVYENASLPIAVDESCITLADVPRVADRADIAVLKLMKCGGLREAKRMIHAAKAHGMEVMLGCMTESNASIAAGAHLAPLLDYADLDGSLLLAEDPYNGPVKADGTIALSDRPGTGARR